MIWARITPELPRAPIRAPWAMAAHSGSISSATPSSPSVTDFIVNVMLVPVSPSGTG